MQSICIRRVAIVKHPVKCGVGKLLSMDPSCAVPNLLHRLPADAPRAGFYICLWDLYNSSPAGVIYYQVVHYKSLFKLIGKLVITILILVPPKVSKPWLRDPTYLRKVRLLQAPDSTGRCNARSVYKPLGLQKITFNPYIRYFIWQNQVGILTMFTHDIVDYEFKYAVRLNFITFLFGAICWHYGRIGWMIHAYSLVVS
jgi:hypothetical protein